MKIARFLVNGEKKYGSIKEDEVVLCEGDVFEGLRETNRRIGLRNIEKYLPPVDPPNVIALGLNYRCHADESNMKFPSGRFSF